MPILWACMWLYFGGNLFERPFVKAGDVQAALTGPDSSALWVFFGAWAIVFAAICVAIAWKLFGARKISVSADELIVRYCILGEPILKPTPIKLSAINDLYVKKKTLQFKGGRKVNIWALMIRLDDDSTEQIAKFADELGANACMRGLLEYESIA